MSNIRVDAIAARSLQFLSPAVLGTVVVIALAAIAFFDGVSGLVTVWETREEYSFGFMVPFISAYLIWQRRELLGEGPRSGSWWGVAVIVLALLLLGIGRAGMIGTFLLYAVLVAVLGLFLSYFGVRSFVRLAMPLAVLLFMVPPPAYLLAELSQTLQLWSSQIGVALIRLAGISVYLEGNVIDLGTMRLQVVEACSGLRYLFPLLTLAFIAAIFFRAALWKRIVVVLSALPITVAMNSVRIAVIGILVEFFGRSMAEGFLHDFEGWVVFLICTALLVAEMALLVRIGPGKSSLSDAFSFEVGTPGRREPPAGSTAVQQLPRPFVVTGVLVLAAVVVTALFPTPPQITPSRKPFAEFPMALGDWQGRADTVNPEYLSMLQLDDYLLADYVARDPLGRINLYVSYYASQVDGVSAHSPRACIPGDGWKIVDLRRHELASVRFGGSAAVVNRVEIQKNDVRKIVYYWFQQRGRITTDEYGAKLYILLDALRRHRTDGAMVRLVADVAPGQPDQIVDRRLEEFAATAIPKFASYIPD
ncbi:MAG: VPLPA-CTERM-specific exosortase XrtD [Rhodocyclaceae bacterium]